ATSATLAAPADSVCIPTGAAVAARRHIAGDRRATERSLDNKQTATQCVAGTAAAAARAVSGVSAIAAVAGASAIAVHVRARELNETQCVNAAALGAAGIVL